MGSRPLWPDAHELVRTWLTENLLGTPIWSETDDNVTGDRIVLELTGGSSDGFDREADLELTAITSDLATLRSLTARATAVMWALAANGNQHGYVDEVRETFGFADETSKNPAERRAIATFTVVVRPQA